MYYDAIVHPQTLSDWTIFEVSHFDVNNVILCRESIQKQNQTHLYVLPFLTRMSNQTAPSPTPPNIPEHSTTIPNWNEASDLTSICWHQRPAGGVQPDQTDRSGYSRTFCPKRKGTSMG